MCASFLSERTENIHLDDLELKSSYDFDACGRSGSRFGSQSASGDSESNDKISQRRLSDLSTELPYNLNLNITDDFDANAAAAVADGANSSLCAVDETRKNDVQFESSEPNNEAMRRLDQLIQLLPRTDCKFSSDVVTNCFSVNSQHRVAAEHGDIETNDTSTRISADSANLQQVTNTVLANNDKELSMNESTHSDTVSDIMEESFPNMSLSTISDLQSSTDLLMSAGVPSVSSDKTTEE